MEVPVEDSSRCVITSTRACVYCMATGGGFMATGGGFMATGGGFKAAGGGQGRCIRSVEVRIGRVL
eukprot:3270515-Pyramimonas_sp.AAC.1